MDHDLDFTYSDFESIKLLGNGANSLKVIGSIMLISLGANLLKEFGFKVLVDLGPLWN